MARITEILASPKHPGRFVVTIDGRPFATVSLEAIDRLQLRVGLCVVEPLGAAIEEAGRDARTYDRALNMLASRARSSSELRRQLIRKGEPPPHVDAAIARLIQIGLLDDASFARQFARSKVVGAGHSRRRLQQELFRKGVERGLADEAIADVLADESLDENAIVERLTRKKAAALATLDPPTRRRRLYAFLARRGYDADDIQRAMRVVLAEDAGEQTTE